MTSRTAEPGLRFILFLILLAMLPAAACGTLCFLDIHECRGNHIYCCQGMVWQDFKDCGTRFCIPMSAGAICR